MAVIAGTDEPGCLTSGQSAGASAYCSGATNGFSAGEEAGPNDKPAGWPSEKESAPAANAIKDEMLTRIACDFLASDTRARVVIDRERRVLWASETAITMLRPPQPVVLRNGYLAFEGVNDSTTCQEWLGQSGTNPQGFLIYGSEGGAWAVISAHARQWDGEDVVLADFILSHPPRTAASSGMAKQFGLTRAECDVIDALVRLEGPGDIAVRLGISINTVRTHIRRLFCKLSINSQVQLVRIAAAFSAG
jgi:DNA-binding CsgD family transcriptional regulator